MRSHMSTAYGVSRNSVLNSLKYFHVVNGKYMYSPPLHVINCLVYFAGIPVDVMHDVLEGVLQLEISCLLTVFIGDLRLFSLDTLNKRISNFAYGNDVSDPPKPLSNLKFKMGGTVNDIEVYVHL